MASGPEFQNKTGNNYQYNIFIWSHLFKFDNENNSQVISIYM